MSKSASKNQESAWHATLLAPTAQLSGGLFASFPNLRRRAAAIGNHLVEAHLCMQLLKMEETTPFPSQKTPKLGAKQPASNHRNSAASRGSASANNKPNHPDAPAAGQAAYRLLCHVHTAGGVIGNSGSIIKQLETLTGSKIRFEEGLPNCHERVVNIVGDAALEMKMSVGGGEEENTVSVSKAQEGLMRVFERVLEVEGHTAKNGKNENGDDNEHRSNGLIVCRLLAPTVQIGALMGKGGKIVDAIRKSTGAKIRVFKKEQIPPCAAQEEELIQVISYGYFWKFAMIN